MFGFVSEFMINLIIIASIPDFMGVNVVSIGVVNQIRRLLIVTDFKTSQVDC